MKIYFPILIALLFLITACEKDEPPTIPPTETSELSLNIVTGVEMTDESGAPIGLVGNPNSKKGDIRAFPNPLVDILNVFVLNGFLTDVWILPAKQDTNFLDLDFEKLLENHDVPLDSISDNKIMEFGFPANEDIRAVNLNVQNLETGYYRIFYKTKAGEIFWDNLKIDKAADPSERIMNLVDEWK